jgi:uncharacterized OB-fold protein
MIAYSCKGCGKTFGVRREFCPDCRGDNIQSIDLIRGKVLESVYLTATPEDQEDSYFIVLVESQGMRLICRSQSEIPDGSKVQIEYRNEIPFALRCQDSEDI